MATARRMPILGSRVDWIVIKKKEGYTFLGSIERGINVKKYPYNKEFELKLIEDDQEENLR